MIMHKVPAGTARCATVALLCGSGGVVPRWRHRQLRSTNLYRQRMLLQYVAARGA
jgi:hypothetical protein